MFKARRQDAWPAGDRFGLPSAGVTDSVSASSKYCPNENFSGVRGVVANAKLSVDFEV
uniref:Uncharacterized protein n=1 Tax=Oryza sativa subsp. japonica TaxID=39947 RepID=Q69X88_ORYSJ|nr:hypothetical protein [Oryza sativa Japonica Group]